MRVLIGALAQLFALQQLSGLSSHSARRHHPVTSTAFGTLAGFTSFSIHAGGPPFTMHLMPRGLPPLQFAGTAGMFFAAVNAVKLVPYCYLGQFSTQKLLYSLSLVPLAPLGVRLGHDLVRGSSPQLYYRVISLLLLVVGIKLLLHGLQPM